MVFSAKLFNISSKWTFKDGMARKLSLLKPPRTFILKNEYTLESYFVLLPRKFYINLFKLETGNHKLPVETGRWDGLDISERKRSLCTLNDIGDDFYYILNSHIAMQKGKST